MFSLSTRGLSLLSMVLSRSHTIISWACLHLYTFSFSIVNVWYFIVLRWYQPVYFLLHILMQQCMLDLSTLFHFRRVSQDILYTLRVFSALLLSQRATFPRSPALWPLGRFNQQEVQAWERKKGISFPTLPLPPTLDSLLAVTPFMLEAALFLACYQPFSGCPSHSRDANSFLLLLISGCPTSPFSFSATLSPVQPIPCIKSPLFEIPGVACFLHWSVTHSYGHTRNKILLFSSSHHGEYLSCLH